MKTQIARSLSAAALAIALLSGSTAAFAATPATTPAFYDDDNAVEEGEYTAEGLEYGAAALGVGAAVVGAAAGSTVEGQTTAEGLAIGATAVGGVAAPIVRIATR
ncbi:MAG: hypothetical protein IT306_24175 [Chloroflexi bacterium]|nr:hypothetical protein [Chloroflexota bacterium]